MSKWREYKFAFIERVLAPIGLRALSLWSRTWRVDAATVEVVRQTCQNERLIVAILHGSAFAVLPLARLTTGNGRRVSVMTSPSRDGKLQDRVMRHLGLNPVKGSSKKGGASGGLALVTAMQKGDVGLLAVDGPRGPVGIPKEGIARLARMADATIVCVSLGATSSIRFGSWDGLFLPLPFARLRCEVKLIEPGSDGDQPVESLLEQVQQMLRDGAEAVASPVLRKYPVQEPKP